VEEKAALWNKKPARCFEHDQVVTNACCGLAVIFCGFISLLIGRKTINIPEIFSDVHGFTGMTV